MMASAPKQLETKAVCLIPNCGKTAPSHDPFCASHRFPQPKRKDGGKPCGECHLQSGEVCDICGAIGQDTAKASKDPTKYRGWSISWDYGYYNAVGPNYDASYEGEEDGWVGNGQTASGRTLDDLRAEIDAWIEENGK